MTKTLSIMYTLKSYCLRGLREGKESQNFYVFAFLCLSFYQCFANCLIHFHVLSVINVSYRITTRQLTIIGQFVACCCNFHLPPQTGKKSKRKSVEQRNFSHTVPSRLLQLAFFNSKIFAFFDSKIFYSIYLIDL